MAYRSISNTEMVQAVQELITANPHYDEYARGVVEFAASIIPNTGSLLSDAYNVEQMLNRSYSKYITSLSPTAYWRFNDINQPPGTNGYDAAILARGDTVAYWELGESSGTTAANSVSGGAHPGTYTGSPTFGSTAPLIGSEDTSVDFNGTTDYVTAAYDAALNPANFTVSGWIYRDADSGGIECILDSRSSAVLGYAFHIRADDKIALGIANGASVISALSTTTIATGRWYHVAGSYDGTNANVYVNGVLEGTSSSVTISPNVSGATLIARRAYGSAEYFSGKIAKVSLHNAVVSTADIAALFVLGRPIADYEDAHHGGMLGAPTNFPGALTRDANFAMDFNGSTDAVCVPYASALNAATFSIMGWIYRDTDTGATEFIVASRHTTTATSGWNFSVSSLDKIQLGLSDGASASSTAGSTSLTTGQWYHVAGTYDGTTSRIYLNGVLDGSGADAYVQNASFPLRIACDQAGANRFNGKIDELSYHGGDVLTAAEILAAYQRGRPA